MTYSQNKYINVICEGKSECNYLQAINRLLREAGIGLVLKAQDAGGGMYKKVEKAYKQCVRDERHAVAWIWVDSDLYKRNDNECMTAYNNKPKGIPDFLFSVYNFEDFLILHLPDDKVAKWISICKADHLSIPLHSDQHTTKLADFFPDYKKGKLPSELSELSEKHVEQAILHSRDTGIPFSCNFIETLAQYIMKEFPRTGSPWNV